MRKPLADARGTEVGSRYPRRRRIIPRDVCPQVFKVAKALAPSVIYIDEVEKVRAQHGASAALRQQHDT